MIQPLPIETLRADFMEGYVPGDRALGARARSTCTLMNQSMRELHEDELLKLSTDLSPAVVWRWMRRRPKSAVTCATHLRNIRVYCRYAVGRHALFACPFTYDAKLRKAVGVKKEAKLRHHSIEAIARVLDHLAARANESWKDARLYALVTLVAYSGVRAMEALCAEVSDIDLNECIFRIRRKAENFGKTDRFEGDVPLPPAAIPVLKDWLLRTDSRWAFPGVRRKTPWTGGGQNQKPLDCFKAAGEAVGVKGFTLLSLRHSYITNGRLVWGMNETQIQMIARHTTTRTQQHYLGKDLPVLKTAVSPMIFSLPAIPGGNARGQTEGEAHRSARVS